MSATLRHPATPLNLLSLSDVNRLLWAVEWRTEMTQLQTDDEAGALRLLGNGVHPLAAAHAWRALAAAHGLGPVDLAADGWAGEPSADEPL